MIHIKSLTLLSKQTDTLYYDINDNPFFFYAMRKSFRNKGIMTSVIKSMIPTLPHSITTLINEDNVASKRVLAKSGLLKIIEKE